ncbi:MAG TPA: MopE-related protein, partial [Saprospiraceae bacterium]|nr:MopE-related protein [Saprospiraceae bacterium]
AGYATNNLDCDDQNPDLHPGAPELCDGLDNDCNGIADDLPVFTYYADNDGDEYGSGALSLDTCLTQAPAGYTTNNLDCDDQNANLHPGAPELCDGLDNDCNGIADDLPVFTYYADSDGDGYGNNAAALDTCLNESPAGYSTNNLDCNDSNAAINPDAQEIVDGLDNNCDGMVDDVVSTTEFAPDDIRVYPNPVKDFLTIYSASNTNIQIRIIDIAGRVLQESPVFFENQYAQTDCSGFVPGLYFLHLYDADSGKSMVVKFVKAGN